MDLLIYNLQDASLPQGDPSLLTPHEIEQAQRRGESYLTIRSLLKRELARRTGIAAPDIAFTYTEHGKPIFAPQPFNISHSRHCLCLAFHHTPIGVDVEYIRPRNVERLAPHFMAEEQLQRFLANNCPQDDFFACWCAAEAFVKHAGDTIWNAKQYPFLYEQGHITPLFPHAPSLELFTPLPGFCGAVAY